MICVEMCHVHAVETESFCGVAERLEEMLWYVAEGKSLVCLEMQDIRRYLNVKKPHKILN